MTRLLLFILPAVWCLTSCATHRPMHNQETQVSVSPAFDYEARKKVAVLPLANAGQEGINLMVTERLAANLIYAGFTVIDRALTDKAARDAGAEPDRTPTGSQLARMGTQLGVGMIVSGSCISSRHGGGDEDSITMLSTRFLDSADGETLIYAITHPDGVIPITRKLAFAVRSAIANDLFTKANRDYDAGRYQAALTSYSTIIRLDPGLIGAWRNRGIAYARSGDYKKALEDLNQAVALNDDLIARHPPSSLITFSTPKYPEKAALLLNRGIILTRSGSPDAALVDFRQALENGADPATVYINRGYARLQLKEQQLALEEFDSAVSAAPRRAETYYQRGLALEGVTIRNALPDAIRDYSRAIELDKRFAAAYAARARVQLRLGNADAAISDYTLALELAPGTVEYLSGRATAFSTAGKRPEAITDYSKVLSQDPENRQALLGRGLSYAGDNQRQLAQKDFEQALKTGPSKSGAAYLELGILKEKEGKYKEAIDNFTKAIEASGKDADGYAYRGQVFSRIGDYRTAALNFTRALELRPDDAGDLFNRGYARIQSGNYQQAIDDLNRAVSLDPANALAFGNRGYAWQQTGNYTQAIQDYSRALSLKPEQETADYRRHYPDVRLDLVVQQYKPFFIYFNRGISYLASGDYGSAIADFDKAAELAPKSAETVVKRGMARQLSGQMEQALADYNRALTLDPQLAEAFFSRGSWYEQSGRFSTAVTDYSSAISLRPDFALAYFSRGLMLLQLDEKGRGMEDIKTAARMQLKQATDYLMTRGVEW